MSDFVLGLYFIVMLFFFFEVICALLLSALCLPPLRLNRFQVALVDVVNHGAVDIYVV